MEFRVRRGRDEHQGSPEDDPWVQYLVARRTEPTAAQLAAAAASATVRCAVRFADDPAFAEAFAAWRARSYRKVCLQARAPEWRRLMAAHGDELVTAGEAADGAPLVAAVAPRRRSDAGQVLGKVLQAWKDPCPPGPAQPLAARAAVLVANAALGLSPGKLAAQCGHAALLLVDTDAALDPRYREPIAQWQAAGAPVVVRAAGADQFAALKHDEDHCLVRDGGLTEVVPGSETVLALMPGVARSGLVRSLPPVE
jgi:peptidyl-tRNA hydrolase